MDEASFSLGVNCLSHIVLNSAYNSLEFGCQTGKNFLVNLKKLLTRITCCHKTQIMLGHFGTLFLIKKYPTKLSLLSAQVKINTFVQLSTAYLLLFHKFKNKIRYLWNHLDIIFHVLLHL